MADSDKDITWVGSSREDLRAFPTDAKQIAGYQLERVQHGLMPDLSKPMPIVGSGVHEIIIDTGDAFRVFFVAKFEEAVYVLHAFQKTTRKTAPKDIDRGKRMYADVVASRRKQKGHAQ